MGVSCSVDRIKRLCWRRQAAERRLPAKALENTVPGAESGGGGRGGRARERGAGGSLVPSRAAHSGWEWGRTRGLAAGDGTGRGGDDACPAIHDERQVSTRIYYSLMVNTTSNKDKLKYSKIMSQKKVNACFAE